MKKAILCTLVLVTLTGCASTQGRAVDPQAQAAVERVEASQRNDPRAAQDRPFDGIKNFLKGVLEPDGADGRDGLVRVWPTPDGRYSTVPTREQLLEYQLEQERAANAYGYGYAPRGRGYAPQPVPGTQDCYVEQQTIEKCEKGWLGGQFCRDEAVGPKTTKCRTTLPSPY